MAARSASSDPSTRDDLETSADTRLSEVPTTWLEAYREAQQRLVDSQSAFQRAMTEAQLAFLKAMEASFEGMNQFVGREVALPPAAEVELAPERRDDAGPSVPPEPPPESIEPPEPPEPPPELIEPPEPSEPSKPPEPDATPPSPEPALEPAAELETPEATSSDEDAETPAPEPLPEPLELASSEVEAGSPEPEPVAESVEPAPPEPDAAPLPPELVLRRQTVQEAPAPSVGLAMSGLAAVSRVVVTDDGGGIATALVEQLVARGLDARKVSDVPPDAMGVVFLGGLKAVGGSEDILEILRQAFRTAKSVARRFTTGRGVFVTVQDTGGDFGLGGRAAERAGIGGLAGLAKSVAREWPSVTVKAIDLERGGRPAWKLAKILAEELFSGGPEVEVGLHADGIRTTLECSWAPLGPSGSESDGDAVVPRRPLRQSSVILVSGGVGSASILAMARQARPRLVVLGRTSLEEEPEHCRAMTDEVSLLRALEEEVRTTGEWRTLDALRDQARRILAAREVENQLCSLREAGSDVRYQAVDLQDRDALGLALYDARRDWGPITGLVHGAGAFEERLLVEKDEAEFDRFFGAELRGLYNLLHVTADDPLELLLFFASSTARTGSRGQADLAMVNEVLNKVAAAERERRGGACLVKSLNWGPWEGGAPDPAVRVQHEARGIRRIPPEVGTRHFVEEIQTAITEQVEVVLDGVASDADGAEVQRPPAMLTLDAFVSAATHPFLEGCRPGAFPELTTALVLEWFSRIVRAHCSDLEVVACRDVRVLRRVELRNFYEGGDAFTVVSHLHGRSTGRELQLELYARDGGLCWTAMAEVVRPGTMAAASSETLRMVRAAQHGELEPWPFSKIYGHALFHGPECQVIREIEGVSDRHLVAILAGAWEMGWAESWRTDVAMVEGGLQVVMLWFQYRRNTASRPAAIQAFHSHFSGTVEGPIRCVVQGRQDDAGRGVCDVAFVNENGTLLAELQGVEIEAVEGLTGDLAIEVDTVEEAEEAGEGSATEEPAAVGGEPETSRDAPPPSEPVDAPASPWPSTFSEWSETPLSATPRPEERAVPEAAEPEPDPPADEIEREGA